MNGLLTGGAAKRLLACLIGGVVLALMWGKQEGTPQDYGYAFRQAVFAPRIFAFLGIGLVLFLLITFWPWVRRYTVRPGVLPLFVGVVVVAAAQSLLHWDDQVGDARFSTLADAVGQTPGISPLAAAFFGWLAWTQFALILALCAAAIVTRIRPLAWVAAALAVVAAVLAVVAHSTVIDYAHHIDHSLGSGVTALGYLTVAAAAVTTALSEGQVAHTRAFLDRVTGWRPGLPLTAIAVVVGLVALVGATWFSPGRLNTTLIDTSTTFAGTGLAPLAAQYLAWLAWVILAAGVAASGLGAYLRSRPLGWAGLVVGVVGVVLTLVTLYDISAVGAEKNADGATGPWQNLGSGGWLAAIAFFLLACGGFQAATAGRGLKLVPGRFGGATKQPVVPDPTTGRAGPRSSAQTLIFVVVAAALFYPPMATTFWQQVLVTEIGIYVLLAIGLNVVVGWAGLLDLGYIAFYAIGSYVTAYLTGSLPIKPPSWLHLSPLWAIPFAIVACLIAGVVLGAPTLRLRGDYLAIVTLGFGEIIRIMAVNANGVTNGPRGVSPAVPHPTLNLGIFKITWGLNNLQYWYLLLFFVVIVVLLFRRLEHSRIGRAWAAVREDEIAASATGINAYRTKLLAFAIGASTSGLAGVLFATQVGFFNPDNFVLNNSILVLAYVVFGGMGSLPGAIAGAASLWWLQEFLRDQVPPPDRQMWVGAIVLVMMIFRSAGLIPARRRQAELEGLETEPVEEPVAVPAAEGLGVAR